MARLSLAALVLLFVPAAGCGGDDVVPPADAGLRDAASTDGGPGPTDAGEGVDGGSGVGLVPVDPPEPPVFPDVIGTLTVALTTDDAAASDTDAPIEVCLTATDCFDMDTPEVDDRQLGLTDELHFEGIDLPRSAVDRVVLRTRSDPATDNDRFTPACMHVRFDGEPVYCNDAIPVHIGTGSSASEVVEWRDPDGLHEVCRSCWGDRTLTHGPMVGAPMPDGGRVWVRSDATRPVALRVGTTPDLSDGVTVDWALPAPEDDFTAVLEARVLSPGAPYYYRVEVGGDMTGPTRPLRAARPASATSLRLAFGSCTRLRPSMPAFAAITAVDPDLFFFAGDNHYANAQHVEAHRWRYRQMRLVPERADMLAEVPVVSIWDDHDFLANNSHGACARPEEALRGFTEYWANPSYGTADLPGVFFRHREGPAEIFALDCRMYRPDVGDPGSRCDLAADPPTLPMSGGPIGPEQMAWLMDGIAASDAPFKLIACGSRFTEQGSLDSWASFDEARQALHDGLADRGAEGVVFLSGDIHRSLLRENPRTRGYTIPEITSSGMALDEPADTTCPGEPGQRFCTRANSFIALDITANELTANVYDVAGTMLHRWTIPRDQLVD